MDRNGLPRNCYLSWYFLGSAILFVYFIYINHTDGELRLRRTAADGWQQCLSVKTLKTSLWIRWVVSPFTEKILCCLLILFCLSAPSLPVPFLALDCRSLEAAVSDASGSPSLGSEQAMHIIIAQINPNDSSKHQSPVYMCVWVHSCVIECEEDWGERICMQWSARSFHSFFEAGSGCSRHS